MTKPTLPKPAIAKQSRRSVGKRETSPKRRSRATKRQEKSDVLISAVISPYLLTYLHHVLQRAEYGALQEGRPTQAANFAQLRKVLCMDARSMEDAFASGMHEGDFEKFHDSKFGSKVA